MNANATNSTSIIKSLANADKYKLLLIVFAILAIAATIAVRLMPSHLPNFTPMGALGLFAGAHLARYSKWWLLLPLAALFLSDIFIGFYSLPIMAAVYASMGAYGLIGWLISKKKNPAMMLAGSFMGAMLFFLVTNAAVWAFSGMYALTLAGLLESYTLAIPFFRSAILGDLVFVGLFFGAYEGAALLLQTQKADAVLKRLQG